MRHLIAFALLSCLGLSASAQQTVFQPSPPRGMVDFGLNRSKPFVSTKNAELVIMRILVGEGFFTTGRMITADPDPEIDPEFYTCMGDQLQQLNAFLDMPSVKEPPRKITLFFIDTHDGISTNLCDSRVTFSSAQAMHLSLCYVIPKKQCLAIPKERLQAAYMKRFESVESRRAAHSRLLQLGKSLVEKASK